MPLTSCWKPAQRTGSWGSQALQIFSVSAWYVGEHRPGMSLIGDVRYERQRIFLKSLKIGQPRPRLTDLHDYVIHDYGKSLRATAAIVAAPAGEPRPREAPLRGTVSSWH